jgi:hypothetical protein
VRRSIEPTYDREKTGDAYSLEIRENGRRLSVEQMPDPFHTTAIRVRGWRNAWRVFRKRYVVDVIVGADSERVEDVLELDESYLGIPGSTRRADWDRHLNRSLGDFAARLAEHDTEHERGR